MYKDTGISLKAVPVSLFVTQQAQQAQQEKSTPQNAIARHRTGLTLLTVQLHHDNRITPRIATECDLTCTINRTLNSTDVTLKIKSHLNTLPNHSSTQKLSQT